MLQLECPRGSPAAWHVGGTLATAHPPLRHRPPVPALPPPGQGWDTRMAVVSLGTMCAAPQPPEGPVWVGVWLRFLPAGWGMPASPRGLSAARSRLAPLCLGGRGQSETGFLPFSQPPARRLFALRPGSLLPGHSRAAAAAVCTGARGTSRTPPATKAGASRLPRTRVPLLEHPPGTRAGLPRGTGTVR